MNISTLRSRIGLVQQEPLLYNTSIEENIRVGKPDATLEEIEWACKQANIHDDIARLHAGYQTNVGAKGVKLSGGQKQRIAIARAIIRKPKILIFDEATSALDNQSERVVQEALDKLAVRAPPSCLLFAVRSFVFSPWPDRNSLHQTHTTTLVIAHRLSTIKNADRIAVISGGKVAEYGTHDELTQKKGIYHHLSLADQGRS